MCVRTCACMCTQMCRICMHMDAEGRGCCQVSSFLTCQLTLPARSSSWIWSSPVDWLLNSGTHLIPLCSARVRGQASFSGPAGILLLTSWLILPTYKVMGYITIVYYLLFILLFIIIIHRYHCNLLLLTVLATISYLYHYIGLPNQTVPVVFLCHICVCIWWYAVKSLCDVYTLRPLPST